MIKAVFFDIDGTLLSHASGGIPESARRALALLGERGVLRFLATGRHILEIHPLLPDLSFDGCVTLNGQICLDSREHILFDAPFPPADARQAVSIFRRREAPAMLVQRDRMYINFVDGAVRQAQRAISSPIPPAGTYQEGAIYQLIVYGDGAEAALRQLPGGHAALFQQEVNHLELPGDNGHGRRPLSCFLYSTTEKREGEAPAGPPLSPVRDVVTLWIGRAPIQAYLADRSFALLVTLRALRDGG